MHAGITAHFFCFSCIGLIDSRSDFSTFSKTSCYETDHHYYLHCCIVVRLQEQ
jgi:hypothetical protein